MLYGTDKVCFRIINTDLENNMTSGSVSYPITKGRNVGIVKHYYAGKQHTWDITEKEGVTFPQKISHTKTSKTNKKGVSKYFH